MELNKNQREAVENITTPLIVKAGPGTGKTHLIIEKIKYLLSKGYRENNILVLTFSKKAVDEIKDRLIPILGLFTEVEVDTFHSFAEKLLRENHKILGLKKDFIVMDQMESFVFLSDNIFNFNLKELRPISSPDREIIKILSFFSKLQDEDISPEEYIKLKNKDVYAEELSYLYKEFLNLKLKESKLEFNDLTYYVYRLLRENSEILKKYQKIYKYVLIDEFQDTNYIQNEIISLLSPNITIVGDKNQSIYKFRGAALSNFNSFKEKYSNAKEIDLDTNYRSYQNLIDNAYLLMEEHKVLKCIKGYKEDSVKVLSFKNSQEEVSFIKNEVLSLINEGISLSQIAILLRTNSSIGDFSDIFAESNIPFYTKGITSFSISAEVKDLSSLIYFLENLTDDISFLRVLKMPSFYISDEDILSFINFAKESKTSYIHAFKRLIHDNVLNFNVDKFSNIYTILSKISKEEGMVNKINMFLDESFYMEYVHKDRNAYIRRKNIDKFISIIERLENNKVKHFSKYIKNLDKVSLDDFSEDTIDAVLISTVHSSKGLEFDYVFVPYMVKDKFPVRKRSDGIEIPLELVHENIEEVSFLEEEKRLFFVAITRAKKVLYTTYSDYYDEGKSKRVKSPFLMFFKEKEERFSAEVSIKSKPNFIVPENFEIKQYSYSQLSLFETCPLKYYYEYILKIPKKKNISLEFGTLVHNTLKVYFSRNNKNDNIDDLKDIYDTYWKSMDKSLFKDEKYLKEYKDIGEERLIRNIEILKPKGVRSLYELNINFLLDDKYKIGGRLDRVDFFEDNSISIVDYKTGKSSNQDTSSTNMQLGLYSLLVKSKFGDNIKDLKLLFTDEGMDISIPYTKLNLEKITDKISNLILKINELEIKATPSYICDYCEYKSLCYKK